MFISLLYVLFNSLLCHAQLSLQLHLYKTDLRLNYLQYDCFYYYVDNKDRKSVSNVKNTDTYQTIEYCRRPFPNDDRNDEFDRQWIGIEFGELKKEKVTARQLFLWSASIDVIERYQRYYINESDYSSLIFYNCSMLGNNSLWFGPFCQYTFDANISFSQQVKTIFARKVVKINVPDEHSQTCYMHQACNRGPGKLCLDWREICDRKLDCFNDGADENQCWQLELNECASNEYRCYNGQCIPEEFFRDDYFTPDCSDGSDEMIYHHHAHCSRDPSFRCEERNVIGTVSIFACGDGQNGICGLQITRICTNSRDRIFLKRWFAFDEHSNYLTYACWSAMICILRTVTNDTFCSKICTETNRCVQLIRNNCPEMFFFPLHPVMLTHVRFVFMKNQSSFRVPSYICYDEQLCDFFPPTYNFNGSLCRQSQDFSLNLDEEQQYFSWDLFIMSVQKIFESCSQDYNYYPAYKNLYKCQQSSKYISKHRLLDGTSDCYGDDDERFNNTCSLNDKFRFRCNKFDKKCFSPMYFYNQHSICDNLKTGTDTAYTSKDDVSMMFGMLCDTYMDLQSQIVNRQSHTDENECDSQWWPCDNHYTRCNQVWNCPNGLDEANCPNSPCPSNHHPCLTPDTNKFYCIAIEKANDGVIDCRGAADERQFCRKNYPVEPYKRYRCLEENKCIEVNGLCNDGIYYDVIDARNNRCKYGDDFRFCSTYQHADFANDGYGICHSSWDTNRTKEEMHLCNLMEKLEYNTYVGRMLIHFSLKGAGNYPPLTDENMSFQLKTSSLLDKMSKDKEEIFPSTHFDIWLCNRGIPVRFGASKLSKCFCPPSYYGNHCEYQNERVSLTVQFQVENPRELRTAFHVVFMLVDTNSSDIHSFDAMVYLSAQNCDAKFNIYLLYAERSRNSSKHYHVRINIWQNNDFNYRASWILPIHFIFLPVNRLAARIIIPERRPHPDKHCSLVCGDHGKCMQYMNSTEIFCLCDPKWSGTLCNKQYHCDCAPGSICLGLTMHDEPICMCPLGKFGQRCYLSYPSCDPNPCQNGGSCVPIDKQISKSHFICICPDEFTDSLCSSTIMKINFQFSKQMIIPSSVFIHFITAFGNIEHTRTTMLKKIAYDQDFFTIYQANPFHIVFIEMQNNYYLAFLREKYVSLSLVTTEIRPTQRCLPIKEVMNETLCALVFLRRIKRYHLPCREHNELACFHDESLMCLCNSERHANCFKFEHNMTHDCQGSTYCENKGKCFQDNYKCPAVYVCTCNECFFGRKCQFYTQYFGLSLDAILGYQIRINTSLSHQPAVLKTSIALVTIVSTIGILSGCASWLTFRTKESQKVGCGIYLYVASIISLLTIITFTVKFWFLVLTQLKVITNNFLLTFNCRSIDALMRFFLTTVDWLNACTSAERFVTVRKNIHFKKMKSKQAAKWVVLILFLFTSSTVIHDSFYHQLIDDTEEERIWCIVKYPPTFTILNSIFNIIHFCVPFLINIISTFFIIQTVARQRSIVRTQVKFKHIINELFKLKHFLISQGVLLLIAMLRLIISLISGCMTSARNPWPFLASYFVSFIPSTFLFVMFVLPSKTYRMEFWQVLYKLCRLNHSQW